MVRMNLARKARQDQATAAKELLQVSIDITAVFAATQYKISYNGWEKPDRAGAT